MDDKFVAILMRKEVYDDKIGLFIFKPINILKFVEIDFKTNILVDSIGNQYCSMNDPSISMCELTECFGYPITIKELKKHYGNRNIKDIFTKYFNDIDKNIYFGKHEGEEMKIILTPKKVINALNDEDYLSSFHLEQIKEEINIPINIVEYLILAINEKELKTTVDEIFKLLYNINDSLKQMNYPLSINEDILKELEKIINTEKKQYLLEDKCELPKDNLIEIDESLNKLNSLIGLKTIKKEINKLIKYLIFIDKVKEKTTFDQINLHMFFTGNPGTGKTTVARLLTDILYKMGYLKNNTFKEITAEDLIAGYVGQTAIKTKKLLNENKGGLIFIDEAYILSSGAQRFAEEALVEILKEMEKNETIFVFAGYKKEMEDFINMNPGLRSRIGYFFEYEDYSLEELYEIFNNKILNYNLKLGNGCKEKILKIIEESKNSEHFGNGRFINKLVEKIIINHAFKSENEYDLDKLLQINEEDIDNELNKELTYQKQKNKIGF